MYLIVLFCRKNTLAGRIVLQEYFDTLPPLPLLVVVNLHSDGQVFAFPSDQTITEQNLLTWLKKLEAELETHISKFLTLFNIYRTKFVMNLSS